MSSVVLSNGDYSDHVSALNRGFAYGDGLFETIKISNGRLLAFDYHLQRLTYGCRRLLIPFAKDDLLADIERLERDRHFSGNSVLKIIVVRGGDAAGYSFDPGATCQRVLIVSNRPRILPAAARLRICNTPLSINPLLARIKHLNRLENVLARAECSGTDYFDGIMLDGDGHVIETTMCNLFLLQNGVVLTPSLDQCGVAGVMRQIVLEQIAPALSVSCDIRPLSLDDVYQAEEIFLTNSLIGVLAVNSVENHQLPVGRFTQSIAEEVVARGYS